MKYYLSVALAIKTKWLDSLKEWFLWNKFIGVEHFYIVDDNKDKPLKDFFKNFSDQITFIDDAKINQSTSQRKLFQIIYDRHRAESHWMAFIDDDEYIMPLQGLTFVNFLKSIEDRRGVELNSRFFGPHGYHKHEGLKCHENNLILDRYWLYESKPMVKSIVNSKIVSGLAEGRGPHRLVPSGVVDCFGNDVDSIKDTAVSPKWGNRGTTHSFTDKIINNQGTIHNPRFVINHYGLRSLEEIEYKLFERGAIMERVSEDKLLYRTHQLIQQLFSTTKSINKNHKVNFNNFYFKSHLPNTRSEFFNYYNENRNKF